MKAIFSVPFQRSEFFFPDVNGVNQITSWGRMESIDSENPPETNKIMIEASQEVIDQLKADSEYQWVEDVAEII